MENMRYLILLFIFQSAKNQKIVILFYFIEKVFRITRCSDTVKLNIVVNECRIRRLNFYVLEKMRKIMYKYICT